MHMNILCLQCGNEAADLSRAAEAHICQCDTETDRISADSRVLRKKKNTYGISLYPMTDEL